MPTDPGHVDLNATSGWIVAAASLLLGWVARGFKLGTGYGALEQQVRTLGMGQAEQKAAFAAHITQDEMRHRELDGKLSALSRDLNQLIGFVHASKEG